MTGKDTCARLREIRNKIAAQNGFEPIPATCSHQGDCPGTCPKCDAELKSVSGAPRILPALCGFLGILFANAGR